jgi:hypothetical protein
MDSKVPSSSPHLSPIFCNYIEPKPDPRFNPNNRTDSVLLNGPKPYTIPNPKANPTRSLTLLCAAQFSPSPYIYIYFLLYRRRPLALLPPYAAALLGSNDDPSRSLFAPKRAAGPGDEERPLVLRRSMPATTGRGLLYTDGFYMPVVMERSGGGQWRLHSRCVLLQFFGLVHNGFKIGFAVGPRMFCKCFSYHKAKQYSLSITV